MRLLLLFGVLMSYATFSWACHTELGDPFIGHHKWGNGHGATMYTENSTALTSTSTWCPAYTGYLEQEFDAIAMEAANGAGAHLNAIAAFEGCPAVVHSEFAQSLKSNYVALFDGTSRADGARLRERIGRMVSGNELLANSCNPHS